MRLFILICFALMIPVAAYAISDIAGKTGKQNGFSGRFPLTGGIGSGTPPPTGKILLSDGSSFILQTNGTSKICRAGGC